MGRAASTNLPAVRVGRWLSGLVPKIETTSEPVGDRVCIVTGVE